MSRPRRMKYQYTRLGLYMLGFVFNLAWAMGTYFNANFLVSRGVTHDQLGIVYSISAAFATILLLSAPRMVRGGMYRSLVSSFVIAAIMTFGLTLTSVPPAIMLIFIVGNAFFYLIEYLLDMFLEDAIPTESETGRVRALFLTMGNLATALAPFMAGQIVQNNQYRSLYITIAAFAVPLILLTYITLRRFPTPRPKDIRWGYALRQILRSHDLRGAFYMQFLLRFFYAIMIVYMPVYLHENLHFTLPQIGIIFGIMLTPFLFIQIPLGRLADTKYGEKEMLAISCVITGIATVLLSFFTISSVVLWAALLFATRVGAAILEIMSETYFFKQVDGGAPNVVGAFRIIFPISYIIAPILGGFLLTLMPFQYMFIIVGLIIFTGMPVALGLTDTR